MENLRFETLRGVWEEIGSPNMEFFNDRLLLQKKVFLLQELGFDLGYHFNLYLHGPYSKDLATDGYKVNIVDEVNKEDNSENKIKAIKILSELEKNHQKDTIWFELLATILYLRNKENKNKEAIKIYLSKNKPYVINLFETGYKKLVDEDLISN